MSGKAVGGVAILVTREPFDSSLATCRIPSGVQYSLGCTKVEGRGSACNDMCSGFGHSAHAADEQMSVSSLQQVRQVTVQATIKVAAHLTCLVASVSLCWRHESPATKAPPSLRVGVA